ncbi:MAG: Asp23/Gls24 family envelope stress response protein [Candidatus Omnitrophica bacterium]|nr:Asp23/Gls24 family envelope stress response protein [Candidatus Omnitrophota bacterium]MCB9747692.1 Asp23/Gls24 family envelope stress response protein [Candidatus Omnitrophota bacterium]
MSEISNSEVGSVHIHKKVIAEVIHKAVDETRGVTLAPKTVSQRIGDLFGQESFPGIIIKTEASGEISLEIRILVRFGLHIPDIAHELQEKIKSVINKTVDVNIKNIDINVQGLERGQK